jgi:hypothetical protein
MADRTNIISRIKIKNDMFDDFSGRKHLLSLGWW